MIKKAYSDKRVASFFPLNKRTVLLFLLLSLIGCTTLSQWKANVLVDELCAKDGGIKVYETVTLPKNRFNEWGQYPVPSEGYEKSTDEYYRASKFNKVSETSNSTIYQSYYWIYRRSDQKLLGEGINYMRRRSDPSAFWELLPYSCDNIGINGNLEEKIFLKSID